MNDRRIYAAGAHHATLGFLVTGGNLAGPHSTEITTDGITFSTFSPLPVDQLHNHCMVALDGEEGEFFVAGGNKRNTTFIYRENQWVAKMPMPKWRMCMKRRPI